MDDKLSNIGLNGRLRRLWDAKEGRFHARLEGIGLAPFVHNFDAIRGRLRDLTLRRPRVLPLGEFCVPLESGSMHSSEHFLAKGVLLWRAVVHQENWTPFATGAAPWTACRHPSTLVFYVSRFADTLLALAMEEYIQARQQGQHPFTTTLNPQLPGDR